MFIEIIKSILFGMSAGLIFAITYPFFKLVFLRYVARAEKKRELKTRYYLFISMLESLESKEEVEDFLKVIRDLEIELSLPTRNFTMEMKEWEETLTKVKERGYI